MSRLRPRTCTDPREPSWARSGAGLFSSPSVYPERAHDLPAACGAAQRDGHSHNSGAATGRFVTTRRSSTARPAARPLHPRRRRQPRTRALGGRFSSPSPEPEPATADQDQQDQEQDEDRERYNDGVRARILRTWHGARAGRDSRAGLRPRGGRAGRGSRACLPCRCGRAVGRGGTRRAHRGGRAAVAAGRR